MIRRIRKGAKGHPGTPWLGLLTVLGVLAGVERGGYWPLLGGLIMLAIFGSIWLVGAYEGGGRDDDTK